MMKRVAIILFQRTGGGGSPVKNACEPHFGDAFLNVLGKAGVSPL